MIGFYSHRFQPVSFAPRSGYSSVGSAAREWHLDIEFCEASVSFAGRPALHPLSLRLYDRGARMAPVDGARTYHLTHRAGWRDPLRENAWERVFWRAHPIPAVKLLAIFWACIDANPAVPPEAHIASLPELGAAARGERVADYDAVRRRLGLPGLDA